MTELNTNGREVRMLHDDETSLAWATRRSRKATLCNVGRHNGYVAIAVGETFAVIHHLITSAADKRITLPAELVQRRQKPARRLRRTRGRAATSWSSGVVLDQ